MEDSRYRSLRYTALFTVLACVASAQQPAGAPMIGGAFARPGPIVIGQIQAVQPASGGATGTLTIAVTEQLRGEAAGPEITLPYSTVRPNVKYPPFAWSRVAPVAGHRVLLFLTGHKPDWNTVEVLDLNLGEDKFLPLVRGMVALEQQAERNEQAPLFTALSGSNDELRQLALDLLLNRTCPDNAECRMKVLEKTEAIANDSRQGRQNRTWAVSTIAHRLYTGFPNSAAVDKAAVASLAHLLTDTDERVRGEAVQGLHGLLFGGGSAKPQLQLAGPDRQRAAEQLRRDAQAGLDFSGRAKDLSDLVARQ